MTAEEKDALLKEFHPDYREDGFQEIKVGPNKGEKAPYELGTLLHSNSRILNEMCIRDRVVKRALVIGGGIAGIQTALDIAEAGYEVDIVEKTPSIGGRMSQLDKTFPTLDLSLIHIFMQYHKLGATSPALKIPTWFVQSASLVGYGLTFIRQIQAIIFRIKELKACLLYTSRCV